jgi:hypothetical protein
LSVRSGRSSGSGTTFKLRDSAGAAADVAFTGKSCFPAPMRPVSIDFELGLELGLELEARVSRASFSSKASRASSSAIRPDCSSTWLSKRATSTSLSALGDRGARASLAAAPQAASTPSAIDAIARLSMFAASAFAREALSRTKTS